MDCGLETCWWSSELGGIGRGMQQVVAAAAGAGKGELRLGALLHCVCVTTKGFVRQGCCGWCVNPPPNLHFLNRKPVLPHNTIVIKKLVQ
jgi:hypothetical protein